MKWQPLFVWLALALLICPVPVVAQEKQDAGEQQSVDEGNGSGDSNEDPQAKVEEVVSQAGKEVKETATDAVIALKSGKVTEAAKKSMELLTKIAFPAGMALVIMIVAYFIAATLSRMASKPVRAKVDETLGRFIGKVVFYVIMLGALLGLLQYFGIGVTSFAAILSAGGLCRRFGVSRFPLEFFGRRYVAGLSPVQSGGCDQRGRDYSQSLRNQPVFDRF